MATDRVRRVSAVSTGSVRIRPEHVGPTRLNTYVWLLTSRRWTAPRPINAYVIEHEQGVVLFDTGQDLASVTDPHYFPGGVVGFLYGRLATSTSRPSKPFPRRCTGWVTRSTTWRSRRCPIWIGSHRRPAAPDRGADPARTGSGRQRTGEVPSCVVLSEGTSIFRNSPGTR
jgi:hypothetical protein